MPNIFALLRAAAEAIPRDEAELLLAHALGKTRAFLLGFPEMNVPVRAERLFTRMAARRAKGEPLHYIIGEREFYKRLFLVARPVLIPRPETETLVEQALALLPVPPAVGNTDEKKGRNIKHTSAVICDIGCGSGAIGLTLAAERPDCRVYLNDTDARAVRCARINMRRLRIKNAVVERGALLAPWHSIITQTATQGTPVIITANLPYLTTARWRAADPAVRNFESPQALKGGGADGLATYVALLKQTAALMQHTGPESIRAVLMEIDPEQERPLAAHGTRIFKKNPFSVQIKKDLAGRTRVFVMLFYPSVSGKRTA